MLALPIFFASCALAPPLPAQPPETSELLAALGRSAAIFARSVPSLTARETLAQRGRLGDVQILKKDRKDRLKKIAFTVPEDFQTHDVVSDYSFGLVGDPAAFHEVRRVVSVDDMPVTARTRHALTLQTASADDETKKRLLEELEQMQLQGAVVDFGPMLLLFTHAKQGDFEWKAGAPRKLGSGTVFVLKYRQISGATTVTEFREKRETRHSFTGQIWLRESDLVPARITVVTEEDLTPTDTLRNEAEIDYSPTPYGLAPATVLHRQYLNENLLVENRFNYADYHGRTFLK
jgi:hypothetical protein